MGRGDYYRWNAKASTDDLLSFTLANLKRLGYVRPGMEYSLIWKRRGERIGAVDFDLADDSITFRYATTPRGGETASVRVTIPFAFTPCHYGGQRKWFMCGCGRSVLRLFIKGQRIACRHCFNLAYTSTREDSLDRMNRKIDKKQSELKDGTHRPKGMHYKTFQKKKEKLYRLESLKWEFFESECARRFPGVNF